MDDLEEKEEVLPTELESRPFYQVQMEYSNHTAQDIFCYNDYMLGRLEESYVSLLEYFETAE